MIDNGHGMNVHITSVFIRKAYGKALSDFVQKNPNIPIILSLEIQQIK